MKWWDCETPETTPLGVDPDAEEHEWFKLFEAPDGWFFWDHTCDRCFGPFAAYEEARTLRDKFLEFVYPQSVKD